MAKKRHPVGSPTAIKAITAQNNYDLELAELVGSFYESSVGLTRFEKGYAPYTEGVGLFQLTGKGSAAEHKAVSPTFSVDYMRSAYQNAVNKVGAKAFATDPEHAAEEAAYLAERPSKDYLANYGQAKLDAAFGNATDILSQHPPVKVNRAAQRAAARRLYGVYTDQSGTKHLGLRGNNLVLALATIGAETKGKYTPSAVSQFLSSWYGSSHEHLKQTVGGSFYTNQGYVSYVGSSLQALKSIGHTTPFHFQTFMPGFAGTGGPSNVERAADSGAATEFLGLIDSVPHLLEWFSDVDNLIRVAFVIGGAILVIVGLVKLTGVSMPNIVPLPV